MTNVNYKGLSLVIMRGSISLDICYVTFRRIRDGRFDQAFSRIFKQRDDLLCSHGLFGHAFPVLPGLTKL